jgi:hypothetical protein
MARSRHMSDMEWSALRLNFHALKRYNADLLKQVEDLTEELGRVRAWAEGVTVDNDLVRRERDEARVRLCIEESDKTGTDPASVALTRGWEYLIADLPEND